MKQASRYSDSLLSRSINRSGSESKVVNDEALCPSLRPWPFPVALSSCDSMRFPSKVMCNRRLRFQTQQGIEACSYRANRLGTPELFCLVAGHERIYLQT